MSPSCVLQNSLESFHKYFGEHGMRWGYLDCQHPCSCGQHTTYTRNAQDYFLLTTPQNTPHSPTQTCAKSKTSKTENDTYLLQLMPPQKSLRLHMVRQSSGQRRLRSPQLTTLHWTVLGGEQGLTPATTELRAIPELICICSFLSCFDNFSVQATCYFFISAF